jgi:hypothetical protein
MSDLIEPLGNTGLLFGEDYLKALEIAYDRTRRLRIILIVIYAIAVIAELLRYAQTRNGLHIFLFLSAVIAIVGHALILVEDINGIVFWPVANWIMVVVSTRLLSNWLHSMMDHHQDLYSRHSRAFVLLWIFLFSVTKGLLLAATLVLVLGYAETITSMKRVYTMIDVACIVEIIGYALLILLCARILFKLWNNNNPDFLLKRRQLLTILLIYLVLTVYFVAVVSTSNVAAYIVSFALTAYFALTILPRDAITGFGRMPNLPAAPPDQPAIAAGQPNIAMGQPNIAIGQPNVVVGQPNVAMGPPTVVISQPTVMTNQPTFLPGQPTSMPGQPTLVPDQSTFILGQPTVASNRSSGVLSQSTVMQDQSNVVQNRYP